MKIGLLLRKCYNFRMSKVYKTLIIALVVIISIKIVYAASTSGKNFGGIVLATEAREITTAEAEGYNCEMNGGSSIEIKVVGIKYAPTAYYIPANVKPKSKSNPRPKKLIIGKYSGFTSINCIHDDPEIPPEIIFLDTITKFSTPKL